MVKHQHLCLVVLTKLTLAASNCGWTQWSKWGACRTQRGTCQPIQTRIRQCRGRQSCCEGERAQVQDCGQRVAACDQCGEWSACCKTGDKYQRQRTCARGFIIQRTETEGCSPLDNAVYSDWSTCSKTCGIDAIKTRTVTFPTCDGQAPEVRTEQTLCTMDDVPACLNMVPRVNDSDDQTTIDRLQAMIEQLIGLIPGFKQTEPAPTPNIPSVRQNTWSPWSACNYESDAETQVCFGKRARSQGLNVERESCPEPYLEWTSWTFAEDGITGQMIPNQQFRTRHLDTEQFNVEQCSPQLQQRMKVSQSSATSSMPDLSQACSYSSVPSAIFEGSTTCIVEFNEQMRSFFDVNYECEEPYGEWTEWETFDAQTESRLRYKKDTISSASFVCDYMDRDLRLIQTTTQTPLPTQAPNAQNWPNAQVPGQPVNYPPGTQFGSDGFKVCYWCQRLSGGRK